MALVEAVVKIVKNARILQFVIHVCKNILKPKMENVKSAYNNVKIVHQKKIVYNVKKDIFLIKKYYNVCPAHFHVLNVVIKKNV